MQRPMQLSTLAIVAIITGVLQIVVAAMAFGIFGTISGLTAGTAAAMFTGWALLILGAAGVVYGIGAWTLARWSWATGIVVAALDVLAAIYVAFVTSFAVVVTVSALVLLVLAVVELFYLYMHDVRTALGHEPGAHPSGQMPTHA